MAQSSVRGACGFVLAHNPGATSILDRAAFHRTYPGSVAKSMVENAIENSGTGQHKPSSVRGARFTRSPSAGLRLFNDDDECLGAPSLAFETWQTTNPNGRPTSAIELRSQDRCAWLSMLEHNWPLSPPATARRIPIEPLAGLSPKLRKVARAAYA
jgi:hypothetical protein